MTRARRPAASSTEPFWAIPLLGVARLDFRAIAGYCAVFFLVYAALVSAAFTIAS